MNQLAEQIKDMVSMKDICEKYGFQANRAGYINCIFHAGDKNASLKLYPGRGGWHCFGCGAGGSVIDFVMRLFDLGTQDACARINEDFSLGLPAAKKQTYREKKASGKAIMDRRKQFVEHARKKAELDEAFWTAFDLWSAADLIAIRYAPERLDGRIVPGYANAMRELPHLVHEMTQAEIERWKFEQVAGSPGLE